MNPLAPGRQRNRQPRRSEAEPLWCRSSWKRTATGMTIISFASLS